MSEISDVIADLKKIEYPEEKSGGIKEFRLLKKTEIKTRKRKFIAYDFETTRIKAGTPIPLYLTAYGESFKVAVNLTNKNFNDNERTIWNYLCEILETYFLTKDNKKISFVAWNGNNYDAYFIARALLESEKYLLRPYLTNSKSMRGLKVIDKENKGMYWEFLDGISMTGSQGKKLKDFIKSFAPDFPKLELDFEETEFDANNKYHCEYAMRDSEGLYHALINCNKIVNKLTGHDLQTTIGNIAIKYFEQQIPDGVLIWRPANELYDLLHSDVKRGGYCWVQKQYKGPIWKYDLNQAYAAAMRDCKLPSHSCVGTLEFQPDKPGIYHVFIQRLKQSEIPFYYKTIDKKIGMFTNGALVETWLTSIEIEHLIKDGWLIDFVEGYYWEQSFNMKQMVDNLETLRFSDPEGPSGPLGTMVKYIGNNAYGKTLENLEGMELVFSKNKPDEFLPYDEFDKQLEFVWFRMREVVLRNYHQPQIGCFITAHVRVVLREAALLNPEKWLYADTDANAFSESMDNKLNIDSKKYGAWKKETDGEIYYIIGKKIYCNLKENVKEQIKKAKGLNIKNLTVKDFEGWFEGKIPIQKQVQKQNFVKFISGQDMFKDLERNGTDINKSKQAKLIDDKFYPL